MALTDGFVAILIANVAIYYVLVTNKIMIWRIIGCFALILGGLTLVTIEDTVPMYFLFGVCAIVGIWKLSEDLPTLVKG